MVQQVVAMSRKVNLRPSGLQSCIVPGEYYWQHVNLAVRTHEMQNFELDCFIEKWHRTSHGISAECDVLVKGWKSAEILSSRKPREAKCC